MLTSSLLQPGILSVFFVAYATVLTAELVGDKTLYTIASLAARFPRAPVFVALSAAFMGKMLAAILFGKILLRVVGHWTSIISAVGFFACALFIWLKKPERDDDDAVGKPRWARVAAVSFGALFFTEWFDTGQVAAAALAANTQALWTVWLGGTLALLTKGTMAMILGAKLGAKVPHRLMRTLACSACCLLGIFSLEEIFRS
jgi:putative Ca2+/H+ antiporter (TMEM165/GDT1 family)